VRGVVEVGDRRAAFEFLNRSRTEEGVAAPIVSPRATCSTPREWNRSTSRRPRRIDLAFKRTAEGDGHCADQPEAALRGARHLVDVLPLVAAGAVEVFLGMASVAETSRLISLAPNPASRSASARSTARRLAHVAL